MSNENKLKNSKPSSKKKKLKTQKLKFKPLRDMLPWEQRCQILQEPNIPEAF